MNYQPTSVSKTCYLVQVTHFKDILILIKSITYYFTTYRQFIVAFHQTHNLHYVRLNLINHVLALFHDKFACNTALRNPVFRWESCKGSV